MAGHSGTNGSTHAVEHRNAGREDFNGPIASVLPMARRAAETGCPVLILGETGIGKGLLAEWIHAHSRRSDGPFVPVNCGAIPETIIDSQLFGHARGSFSGATSDYSGLVRAAEAGTLFLDEISELPLTAQTRLLRLLQDGEAQPVGHPRPIKVDVRVVAATHEDLPHRVRQGRFRQDLYFRLDVIRFSLKALREQPEQIEKLLAEFNLEFAAIYQRPPLVFDPDAVRVMRAYHWPGNVRQLRVMVERLHVLCEGERISAGHLRDLGQLDAETDDKQELPSMRELKHDVVRKALQAARGNVAEAADSLGVHRSTIYRWLARNTISA